MAAQLVADLSGRVPACIYADNGAFWSSFQEAAYLRRQNVLKLGHRADAALYSNSRPSRSKLGSQTKSDRHMGHVAFPAFLSESAILSAQWTCSAWPHFPTTSALSAVASGTWTASGARPSAIGTACLKHALTDNTKILCVQCSPPPICNQIVSFGHSCPCTVLF